MVASNNIRQWFFFLDEQVHRLYRKLLYSILLLIRQSFRETNYKKRFFFISLLLHVIVYLIFWHRWRWYFYCSVPHCLQFWLFLCWFLSKFMLNYLMKRVKWIILKIKYNVIADLPPNWDNTIRGGFVALTYYQCKVTAFCHVLSGLWVSSCPLKGKGYHIKYTYIHNICMLESSAKSLVLLSLYNLLLSLHWIYYIIIILKL